jgi:hypothetical protein
MSAADSQVTAHTAGRRHDSEAHRRFWIAFVLAFMTSFGIAASVLALVAAGLALVG